MSDMSDIAGFDRFVASSDWTKESSLEESIGFLKKLASHHAEQAGPYRKDLEEILRSSDWGRLTAFGINYQCGSVDSLYHTRQTLAFFEKLERLPLGVDKENVAYEKFQEAELKCRETNHRLRAARRDGTLTPSRVASVLYTAQQKITSVLGNVPSLDELTLQFGPGANTSIKATASSARWKLNAQPTCSTELVPSLEAVLRNLPHYALQHRTVTNPIVLRLEEHLDNFLVDVQVTPGRLQFVPKNAKTYRSIVVEPVLNSMVQKGIGSFIRAKLRNAGIDLRSQADRNKRLAQRASFDGSLATIDLSAASDTISQEIVNELLPLDWVSFLRNFRTGTVMYRGELITLEKFSSMGNAYTFELETLIFWALAWACASVLRLDASETCSFGDDILLPTGAVELLVETLNYCGFSVNAEKSFVEGPFRESCGGDFYNGIDIRPYYQKDLISGRTLFTLHNYYMRTLQPEFAQMVVEAIPESLRIFGPDGYGDGHLIGSWHHTARRKKKHIRLGYGGVIFDTFSLKPRLNKKPLLAGDRLLPCYSIYVAGTPTKDPLQINDQNSDHYTVRGSSGWRRLSIYTLSTGVFLP